MEIYLLDYIQLIYQVLRINILTAKYQKLLKIKNKKIIKKIIFLYINKMEKIDKQINNIINYLCKVKINYNYNFEIYETKKKIN